MSAPRWFANKENLLTAFRSHGFKTRATTSGHIQILQPREGFGPDLVVATLPGTNTLGNRIAKNQIAKVKRMTGIDIRFDPPPKPKAEPAPAAPAEPPVQMTPLWKPGVLGGTIHKEDLQKAIYEVVSELWKGMVMQWAVGFGFLRTETPAPPPPAPPPPPPAQPAPPQLKIQPQLGGPRHYAKESTTKRMRGSAALTHDEAVAVYERWMNGESQQEIGISLNLSQVSVSRYCRMIRAEKEKEK